MIDIMEQAKSMQEELVKIRRHLHENPEIKDDLPETTEYVMEYLKSMGYEPYEICKSGITAVAGGKKPGKTILIRADMDALPYKEETDLPFKSKNNYMHACGHDMHTAWLLGTAKLLKKYEDTIQGTVKFMFQPEEEGPGGALKMIKAGVLSSPNVDAVIAAHAMAGMYPSSTIAYKTGPIAASVDVFRITITGRGGHGAMPNFTIDPINAGCHLHTALQEIISREVPPSALAVLTIGRFHGGEAPNAIPSKVIMEGTVRTADKSIRELILKRLTEISTHTASAFNTKADIEILNGCPTAVNDTKFTKEIIGYASEVWEESKLLELDEMLMGSEDFAYMLEKAPGAFLLVGAGNEGEGYIYPQHHPQVTFNEDILYHVSGLLAHIALSWLNNN